MKNLHLIVTIDRPKGFQNEFGTVYPLNYGYIEGIVGGDGEKQDAYCIEDGDIQPRKFFEGYLIGIVIRKNDSEEKWLVAKKDKTYTQKQLTEKIKFLEKYFNSSIEFL